MCRPRGSALLEKDFIIEFCCEIGHIYQNSYFEKLRTTAFAWAYFMNISKWMPLVTQNNFLRAHQSRQINIQVSQKNLDKFEKQSTGSIFWKSCSKTFCKNRRKIPVMKPYFIKKTSLLLFSCELCKMIQDRYSVEHLWTATSVVFWMYWKLQLKGVQLVGRRGEASPAQFRKLKSVPILNTRLIIQIVIAVVFYNTPEEAITLLLYIFSIMVTTQWNFYCLFLSFFNSAKSEKKAVTRQV